MSARGIRAGRNKQAQKREAVLEQFWGDELSDLPIWNRLEHDGFASIPRTLLTFAKYWTSYLEKGSR